MENTTDITQIIIDTINTIFGNLFSSIDNNLYSVLDDITFISSDILYDKNFVSESEKKKYIRRLNMRRLYENKSKAKKILAMLLYPDITYYLIKMKLE